MRALFTVVVLSALGAACWSETPAGTTSSDLQSALTSNALLFNRCTPGGVQAQVERNATGGLRLAWTGAKAGATFAISLGALGPGPLRPVGLIHDGQAVEIRDPDPTARWFFRLHGAGAAELLAGERRLPLAGAANFRDLGGYATSSGCNRVRWGTAFRSDALPRLTDADGQYLVALGVRQVIDFRTVDDVTRFPDRLPTGIAHTHLPIRLPIDPRLVLSGQVVADEAFVTGVFSQVVDTNADVYAGLFRALADKSRLPLVYHCTAGEARTGIATALLFEHLGIPEDTIASDFVLSHAYTGDIVRAQEEQIRALGGDPARLATVLRPPAGVIRGVLAHVRARYGSVAGYLATAGVDAATLAAVRSNLLQ